MEQTFTNLLETLPSFLKQGLRNSELALQDVPPIVRQVASYRASQGGVKYDFQLRTCAEVVGRVLDDICHEQLEAIGQQSDAFPNPARLIFSILLVRTQYLASLVHNRDIRSGGRAIDLLRLPDYTKKVFPKNLPPSLRAELELEIQGMMNEERTQSGSVASARQIGLRILAEALWNDYESLISTVPSISKPESPEVPEDREQSEGVHRPSHQAQTLLPAPPAYYVPTETVEWVTKALIAAEPSDSPCYQVIVLHGKKGVGKTTAAKAVLQHEPLRQFFRDGVLYIPLEGQEDRQLALWRACRQAGLAVERAARQDELQYAFWQWARQEDRLALLVLDEPQRAEDLLPLLNVGPQVRLLIMCQDRQSVARAIEEYWAPASDLVFWQAVRGLTPQEGLRLVKHWQPSNLSPDEEETRRHVGELLHWHPSALRSSVLHAQATSWQAWEAEVIEGNLEPDDLQELAAEAETMWARLSLRDQQALSELRRTFHETSSFGPGIAATVWNEKVEQAAKRMSRLEGAGAIEQIAEEPWPWQGLIQAAYGGQDRYRLSPLVRMIRRDADKPRWYDRSGWQGLMWRLRIASRSRGLMAHLQPAEPRSWLRELALALVLIRHESKWNRPDLEKRLQELWEVKGLFPPAEVWIDFKGLQWFHGSPRIFLAVLSTITVVVGILWAVAVKASIWAPMIFWPAIALIAFCVLPLSILVTRQRAYWTLLLGLYDPEMPEVASIQEYRKQRGLSDPFSGE